MPIPSRLAGLPESLERIFRSGRVNAAEQRAAERHAAWQQNLAAVRAQVAQQAQMQRGAMQQLMNEPQHMNIIGGANQIRRPVTNPEFAQWGTEGEEGEITLMPSQTIPKDFDVTGRERLLAHKLYSDAFGTNMPGASALAKILGAQSQQQWNATSGAGGMPFGAKQRAGYSESLQDFIGSAMADAMAKGPAGMKGSFGDRTDPIDLARKTIMQDVWTVARQIASQSKLADPGRVFQQILDAMAKGVIDPIQISQIAGKDAVEGDEGFMGYFTRNTRGLQAQPLSRDQLRQQYEAEYGPIGQANSLGLPPPN